MKIRILEQHPVVRYDRSTTIEGEDGKPVTLQSSKPVPPGEVVDVPSDLAISLIGSGYAEEAGEGEKITLQAYPEGWKDPEAGGDDAAPAKPKRKG